MLPKKIQSELEGSDGYLRVSAHGDLVKESLTVEDVEVEGSWQPLEECVEEVVAKVPP